MNPPMEQPLADTPLWSLQAEAVYGQLRTTAAGLSSETAQQRLASDGPNEVPEPAERSLIWRFLAQLTHLMAFLLWMAGALAYVSGTPLLACAIWAVIWINATFSFWQEFKAERALAELKKVLPAQTRAYRDGALEQLAARLLVVGDVIELEEGDRVPADARLVASHRLTLDASVLTGESTPVVRHAEPVWSNVQHIVDVPNLVLAGTTVLAGRGTAVVFRTGTGTEFGRVAHLTATVRRERSSLEIQVAHIVRVITALATGTGLVVFLLSTLLVGMHAYEGFLFAIGIIVALVPEGLLPMITMSLALGVQHMARKNALVRRLSAVEGLSATDVICTDKTGTLTENKMTVRVLWVPAVDVEVSGSGWEPRGEVLVVPSSQTAHQVQLLLAGSALCTNARLRRVPPAGHWHIVGDPTEGALLVAAVKGRLHPEELMHRSPRLREISFDFERKMMTVVVRWGLEEIWQVPGQHVALSKGAPLELVRCCSRVVQNGSSVPMTDVERAQILAANDRLAAQGFRVLALAAKAGTEELLTDEPQRVEQDLTFIGLTALMDPPRAQVPDAMRICHEAGIRVTMITGDYGLTAEAVARSIGLVGAGVRPRVVSGRDLDTLSQEALRALLSDSGGPLIFARVMPEHKLRIVQAYQSLGHTVAVTGDGVNDTPALRAAAVGIAMGQTGTDVARQAADIILLDDNFATIVSAIEQGRAIYANIRKFITYILASNVAELAPFLAMVLLKIPPALNALQVLSIDLGTDILPALSLAAEPAESGAMRLPPRPKSKPILDRALLTRAYGFLGAIAGAAGMLGFFATWWQHGCGLQSLRAVTPALLAHTAAPATVAIYQQATTVCLTSIVACQIGNVFACRSEVVPTWVLGFFSNRLIWLGIGTELLLNVAMSHVELLRAIFATAPNVPLQTAVLLCWPPLLLGAAELLKKRSNARRAQVL